MPAQYRDREAEEGGVNYKPVNFQQKFELFSEQWQPKVIAETNDYHQGGDRTAANDVWI